MERLLKSDAGGSDAILRGVAADEDLT